MTAATLPDDDLLLGLLRADFKDHLELPSRRWPDGTADPMEFHTIHSWPTVFARHRFPGGLPCSFPLGELDPYILSRYDTRQAWVKKAVKRIRTHLRKCARQ